MYLSIVKPSQTSILTTFSSFLSTLHDLILPTLSLEARSSSSSLNSRTTIAPTSNHYTSTSTTPFGNTIPGIMAIILVVGLVISVPVFLILGVKWKDHLQEQMRARRADLEASRAETSAAPEAHDLASRARAISAQLGEERRDWVGTLHTPSEPAAVFERVNGVGRIPLTVQRKEYSPGGRAMAGNVDSSAGKEERNLSLPLSVNVLNSGVMREADFRVRTPPPAYRP